MRKRRETEVFNLSFMDCICCGFGAIILLFILTIGPIKKALDNYKNGVSANQTSLEKSLSIAEILNKNKQDELNEILQQIDQISSQNPILNERKSQLQALEKQIAITQQISEQQASELTALKEEAQLIASARSAPESTSPVGVSTDANHIVFIIDTSGSMREIRGGMSPVVLNQIEVILNAYPEVQGIQILDTNGSYIVTGSEKKWMKDTKNNRMKILRSLYEYPIASVSDPTPGLISFFKDFQPQKSTDKKIGVYIFGDEFPQTTAGTLSKINQLNPRDPATQKRPVTISGVGFPFRLQEPPRANQTGYKFASLMRQLTYEHGGAFMVVR
jgi:hypothetical protein